MGYEVNGQPGAIAAKDYHSVNACCQEARVDLYTGVIDHRTVRRDTFRGLDAVNAGGDFETVERDISCQGIDGDTSS